MEVLKNMSNKNIKNKEIWINPHGGLGDTLMLSGVLKQVADRDASKRFNLARRCRYLTILEGHPAIREVGFPPKGSKIISNDYWAKEELGGGSQRAYQILARTFGLSTPIEEKLYLPGKLEIDPILGSIIPWKEKNILIAPFSDSPRKMMFLDLWHKMVEKLINQDFFVLQAGKSSEVHIENAYSLIGVTTPRQIISLIKKCDLVITVDNFIMHAAHLIGVPAIVLWGPTLPDVYGYEKQAHLKADKKCEFINECLGYKYSENYSKPCPLGLKRHCMNKIPTEKICSEIEKILNR